MSQPRVTLLVGSVYVHFTLAKSSEIESVAPSPAP